MVSFTYNSDIDAGFMMINPSRKLNVKRSVQIHPKNVTLDLDEDGNLVGIAIFGFEGKLGKGPKSWC